MPTIFLAPSTQEYIKFYNGIGTEQYYMNLIVDAMIPYLEASNISYTRNKPEMTTASSIQAANEGNYDAYIALHTNQSPPNMAGQMSGVKIYYSMFSEKGKNLAEIIGNNFKSIYYNSQTVSVDPSNALAEVNQTRAPAALIEIGYHDNASDVEWLRNNIDAIARNIVMSLADYFKIPFKEPSNLHTATVDTDGTALNVRIAPSLRAPIIAQAHDGERLVVVNTSSDWYEVMINDTTGYVMSRYMVLNY